MKSWVLVICFCLGWIANAQNQYRTIPSFVHASDGLSLRDKPSTSGKKLAHLSYGTAIKIHQRMRDSTSISGLSDVWVKVSYNDTVGYVFGAYLSLRPPFVTDDNYPYLIDYLFAKYPEESTAEPFEIPEDRILKKQLWFREKEYILRGSSCDLWEQLYWTGANVQETYVVLSSFMSTYKVNLDLNNFTLDEEGDSYYFNFDRDNGEFSEWVYVRIALSENGNLGFVNVGFDWEGGGGTLEVSEYKTGVVKIQHTYSCH